MTSTERTNRRLRREAENLFDSLVRREPPQAGKKHQQWKRLIALAFKRLERRRRLCSRRKTPTYEVILPAHRKAAA